MENKAKRRQEHERSKNRILLDCTLRDGGYVNDWEFGHDKNTEIFQRQVSSGVEMIQIGFLDDRRKFDINRTIMPDTQSIIRCLVDWIR